MTLSSLQKKKVKKSTLRNKADKKICPVCKKEFTSKSTNRRGWLWAVAKYCSFPCAHMGKRNREIRTCRVCGKEFKFIPSQLRAYKGAGKFCSKKCHGDYDVQKNRKAPIKDKWGRTKRRDDIVWQKAVRDRDKCICQKCGKYEKYIHTHHINPRGRRPDLKHDVNNGICLCGHCHGWVHTHPKEAKVLGLLSDKKYELNP